MTRYFYDCPLKAAYMHKHHGLRVGIYATAEDIENADGHGQAGEWWDYDEVCCDLAEGSIPMSDLLAEMNLGRPIYVHPESEHLLRPQHADVVGNVAIHRCFGLYVGGTSMISVEVPMRHNSKSHFCMPMADCRIVMRAGKPFIWPEREAA